ncbi:unnamed protein product [Kuraishia capsulata CBS 1993]|uniref:Amino acid permease/ SLC12A domain-containing protein n=1 Tax=Kuraishia capsulata CBS 1993 TaxID=1382522 RepID=W6MMZ4_9ASCO|nr:uncharacterized protein KUCA_T00003946001 [Kuraishia capsulata CBS 1993]CDK27966.1 unnamed protein product [Kuraishia capsulata CBS 1993]
MVVASSMESAETEPLLPVLPIPIDILDDIPVKVLNIDTPDADLVEDANGKTLVVRPLIPLDESLPHTRILDLYSTSILFLARMMGSGIFATPSGIFTDCQGSVPLFLLTWILGGIIALSGLSLYLELGSLLPVNGATKIFLEYIFPNPKFLASVVFGCFTVLFSLSSTNAIVFGEYARYSLGLPSDEYESKKLGVLLILFAVILHGISRRFGILAQNLIGGVKLFLLFITTAVCLYVLILPSSVTNIENNLSRADLVRFPDFSKFSGSLYASAVLKAIYSFGGWTTAHTVQNEIKDPIQTLKVAGPLSLGIIMVAYMLMNVSYLVVIPHDELLGKGQLVGALFFTKIFGRKLGELFLSSIIAVSAAGNVFVVVYSDSRLNQAVAREGFLPFSKILLSNRPWGSPLASILLHGLISSLVICLPRAESGIYNYIVSMQIYPNQLFHAILSAALLFKLRPRFPMIRAPLRAPTALIYCCLIGSLSIVISPFLPWGSQRDQSFALVGLSILGLGAVYWLVTVVILPRVLDYQIILKKQFDKYDGMDYFVWTKSYDREELPHA